MSTNNVYHSITKIPTFITKSGLNLVNNYYDRYSIDHCSSGSAESIEGYYDGMYDQDIDSSVGILSPSPFSPTTQKYLNEHENDSHHHPPYTHHQNPSPTNDIRHSIYSLSKSSTSSIFSSTSSIIHIDPSDDPSTNAGIQEKSDSFMGIFKNLFSKAKKGGQYLFDIKSENENEKHNENGEEDRIGHIGKQKSHNDLLMNHLPTSTLPNKNEHNHHNQNNNKDTNNISALMRPPLYNHTFPFISNEDLFDSKIISPCSVRKKDNIYDENSSKLGFLYQKDEFIRTLIYSPTGISPLEPTFPSHFEHFSPQSPSFPTGADSGEEKDSRKRKDSIGEKGEALKFASEEMNNEKDHLIQTFHMSKSNHHPHFNSQHSNSFLHLQQQPQHHETTEEENSSYSTTPLHQDKSPSTSASNITNDKNSKDTTTDKTKNKNMNFKAKSKIFIPYPIQSLSSSVNSSSTSLTSNENSDDLTSSTEDIIHIQNCTCDRCNYRNMMKSLGQKNNKIPSLSPPKSSHDKKHHHHQSHSTSRNKYNIFDTLFYETYQNQNNDDKAAMATTTTNSTPMSSIFKDNHGIMTKLIINSPLEEKTFQFPHNNFFTINLFNSNTSNSNKNHNKEEEENQNDHKSINDSHQEDNYKNEETKNNNEKTTTTIKNNHEDNEKSDQKKQVHENEKGKKVSKEVKVEEKENDEEKKEKECSPSLDSSSTQSVNFTKYYNKIVNNWQLNHLDFNDTTNLGIGKPKFDREESIQEEINDAFTSQ